jgi:hypothetical protein
VAGMNDENQTPAEQTPVPSAEPPTEPLAETPRTPLRTRLRDRLRGRSFRLRTLAAVAVAGLVVGGAAGALIGYVAHDDGHGRPSVGRLDGPPDGRPPGPRMVPPGGQLPPGTAPQQQEEDASPQEESDS